MRFVLLLLLLIVIAAFLPQFGFAQERQKASIAIVYNNNSNSAFNSAIDEHVMNFFHKKVDGIYNLVSGDNYKKNLFNNGTFPSPSVIVDAVQNDNIDYIIYLQLQPFQRKEKVAIFRYGKDMTVTAILNIYNGNTGKCLFSKTFSANAADDKSQVFLEDSITSWITIRSKNLGLESVDKVLYQAGEYISVNLPLDPLPHKAIKQAPVESNI
ncbi:MAG: hypothetical protein H6Q74_1353 [Firmicutes bacterium]|nr:hypothetical protein [Bacillota bacterium]